MQEGFFCKFALSLKVPLANFTTAVFELNVGVQFRNMCTKFKPLTLEEKFSSKQCSEVCWRDWSMAATVPDKAYYVLIGKKTNTCD